MRTEHDTTYTVLWSGHLWIGGALLFVAGCIVGLSLGVLLFLIG